MGIVILAQTKELTLESAVPSQMGPLNSDSVQTNQPAMRLTRHGVLQRCNKLGVNMDDQRSRGYEGTIKEVANKSITTSQESSK